METKNARSILDTLGTLEYGALIDALSDAQQEIIEGVSATGKAGQLTLTLKYRQESPGQVLIESDLKSKVPQMPRGKTLFFITPEFNLTRNDPRQVELELRAVPAASPQPLKNVG